MKWPWTKKKDPVFCCNCEFVDTENNVLAGKLVAMCSTGVVVATDYVTGKKTKRKHYCGIKNEKGYCRDYKTRMVR